MSGDTRHFWHSIPSIYTHVIKPNNADVFLYTNKNTCCSYNGKKRVVDEEHIFRDCFQDHLIDHQHPDKAYSDELEFLTERYKKRIKNYSSTAKTIWYKGDIDHGYYMLDQWLKVKKCCERIHGYDQILRIRPDIGWQRKLRLFSRHSLRINVSYRGGSLWAKEYLYFGGEGIMKKISSEFVDYIGENLEPSIVGDDDFTLASEIQFGKYLRDRKIRYKSLKSIKYDVKRDDIPLTGEEPYYHIYNGASNIVNNYVEG